MSVALPDSAFSAPPDHLPMPGQRQSKLWPIWLAVLPGAVLVALLPPALSVAAIIAAAAVLFLLTRPFAALCALAFAVPFESLRNMQIGGFNVTVTNLVVFTLAAALIGRGVSTGRVDLGPAPWRTALLIYGAVLILSVSQATNYVGSIKELLKWGQLLFVYLAGVSMVRTRAHMRTLLAVLFAAVIAESLVGVAQTFLHAGPSSFSRGAILRSSGTFEQPNPFAGYLNMSFPLAVACLRFRVFPRNLMVLVTLITAAGVISSLSRGAELGSIVALLAIFGVTSAHVRTLIAVAGVSLFGVICLAAIGIIPSSVTQPLAEGFGVANVDVVNPTPVTWSVAERLAHMEAGLGMYSDHPVLGVGIGNYPAAYPHFRVANVWWADLGHAHNYYINIAAEAGTLGFLAWILLLASAIVICTRSYRRAPDALGQAAALGGLGVIAAFAVHMFFDDLLVHGMEAQIALVMVVATLAGYGPARDNGAETREG